MKTLLLLWALPITILGAWYGLSYYDMSFGIFMLTRDAHDLVFQIYGNIPRHSARDDPAARAARHYRRQPDPVCDHRLPPSQADQGLWVARQEKSAELSEARVSAESLSSAP